MEAPPATRPSWARQALSGLAKHGLLSPRATAKLYRASLPRPYKHLTPCGPRFHLQGTSPDLDRTLLLDGRPVGHTQPLSKVENAFRGEACFLLGTGPSIKALDLKALHQFPLIGVNGAIAVMQPLGLRPRHYTVTDLDFFANRFSMIRAVIESGSDCFFSAGGLRIIAERAPELLRQGEHFYLSEVVNRAHDQPRRSQETFLEWASQIPSLVLPSPPRDDDSRVGWSRDLRHGVFCSRTILFRALQMAAFLGYRRLYVLGMDLNYRGPASRAYEEGKDARPTKIERDFEPFILPAFRVLQQEIDEGRLEVFNLSNASRLPESVIPRLSLEAALERERA